MAGLTINLSPAQSKVYDAGIAKLNATKTVAPKATPITSSSLSKAFTSGITSVPKPLSINNGALSPSGIQPGIASSNPTKNITTLSTANASEKIPIIQAKTDTLAQTGVKTDVNTGIATTANGIVHTPPKTVVSNIKNEDGSSTTKYSDGTEISTPAPQVAPTSPTGATATSEGYNGDTFIKVGDPMPKDANGNFVQLTQYPPGAQSIIDSHNALMARADAATADLISATKNNYESLIRQQKESNAGSLAGTTNALIRSGAMEHDVYSNDRINAQVTKGNNDILDLQNKEDLAIAQAKNAGLTQDIQLQDKINTEIEIIRKEKQDAIIKQNDAITAAATKLKDQQRTDQLKTTSDINTILEDYYKNGGNDPAIVAQIKGATTQQQAIDAAGSTLKTMTGDFADYPQYANDAKANGLIPLSATDWLAKKQKTDIANKSAEAFNTAYQTARGKAKGETSITGTNGGLLPVTGSNGITFQVPASVAPYVKIAENGVKYIDASGLSAAEKGKILKDAFNGGVNPVPVITDASMALDVNNITDATLKLKDMRDAFTSQTTESALARDTYYAAAITAATALQTNPQAVGLNIYQDAALDILKAMSGTKGFRGGTSMVDQVKASFPKATDTQDVVNQKIDNMQKLINDRQTGLIGKPNASDQVIIDEKNSEKNLTTNLNNIKTTNPTLWDAASKMFVSNNPNTGQPYSASDILQVFPELK